MLIALLLFAAAPVPGNVTKALKKHDLATLKAALDKGLAVDAELAECSTPLLVAATHQGDTEAVKLLLERGAKVDAADCDGLTSLMWAAGQGDVATLRALLAKKPQLEAKSTGFVKATAYQVAACRLFGMHSKDVQLLGARHATQLALAEAGAAWDAAPPNTCTRPLVIAAGPEGSDALLAFMLAHQPNLARDGAEALAEASLWGGAKAVRMLIDAGVSPAAGPALAANRHPSSSAPPLWQATQMGRLEVMKVLLEKKAPVDAVCANDSFNLLSATTPLMECARKGDLEGMKLLLAAGADWKLKDAQGRTARALAEAESQVEAVLLLAALEPKVPGAPDPSAGFDALVWGGGKTEADGKKWLEQWQAEAGAWKELVVPQAKLQKSADVPGMNPGFHIALLGVCPSKETRAVLKAFKLGAERVYLRKVTAVPEGATCPLLTSKREPGRVEVVSTEGGNRLHVALVQNGEQSEVWATLRDAKGVRLDGWREAQRCPVTMKKEPAGVTVTWECSPECNAPYLTRVALGAAGGKVTHEASAQGYWSSKCDDGT